MQVAAGQIGQPPARPASRSSSPSPRSAGCPTPEEFEDIVLRTDADGRKVRIKDIGRVELGAKQPWTSTSKVDGQPNASLAVFAAARRQRPRHRRPRPRQDGGAEEELPRRHRLRRSASTRRRSSSESINEVFHTLIEAIILVAIVVLVFLQNWRSALIPLVAVPVAIIGTFAVMAAIGFSLNNLTLFGLVLAIGIVVDDAIVVVEAVEHHIEQGMTPRQAAHKAMEQVSGPVVAVALVLSAVFVPCAFISGITGQFFRQFALTIAVSTVISAFNSLTLSPALAAMLLQPRGAKKDLLGRLLDLRPGLVLPPVQLGLPPRHRRLHARGRPGLARQRRGAGALRRPAACLTWWTSGQLPTGYIPNQDQGRFYIAVQLPDAASLERTQEGRRSHHRHRAAHATASSTPLSVAGQSFTLNANGSNFGNLFVTLDDFDKRRRPEPVQRRHRRRHAARSSPRRSPRRS